MIHRLIVYNQESRKGLIVFDRQTVAIQNHLMVSLIDSMVILSKQLGKVEKGHLKEIEVGKYQISLLDNEGLTYIIIQGSYDNELFTRRILNIVVEKYHQKFLDLTFTKDLAYEDMYQDELAKFIETLNFPDALLPIIDGYARDMLIRLNYSLDLLFLTDLDNGISKVFTEPEVETGIITLLMQILSEIPLEKAWLGEYKIPESNPEIYEGWIIFRIGLTEFCVIARGNYPQHDRDMIIDTVEEFADLIHETYLTWSIKHANQDWLK
ncbi:MAG: hypothetical protein INQ03_18950 [Candidatus Heimdallarchaeota archaeon]|nr:hypothetical protein [Candidatus Heimdallarchaeota archaeon]